MPIIHKYFEDIIKNILAIVNILFQITVFLTK